MSIELRNHQLDAVQRMRNGCILCGGVGSGKSRAALSYYYLEQGGDPISLTGGEYMPMDDTRIQDLYIITTARKRDTLEWNGEERNRIGEKIHNVLKGNPDSQADMLAEDWQIL